MRDTQLGSHTVRSHVMTVARTHLNDWLIIILLVVIFVLLIAIHLFYWFVGEVMMEDLKYPYKVIVYLSRLCQ